MKFCTVLRDAVPFVSVVTNDGSVDLSASVMELPREIAALLAAGEPVLQRTSASTPRRYGVWGGSALNLEAIFGEWASRTWSVGSWAAAFAGSAVAWPNLWLSSSGAGRPPENSS